MKRLPEGEFGYRLLNATMTLLRGDHDTARAPDVLMILGDEIRFPEQTAALFEMLTAQERSCIYVEFPREARRGGPFRAHVFRKSEAGVGGFDVTGRCDFWAADETRPLLIVSPGGERGHFELIDQQLVHRAGPPPGDLVLGVQRATRRIRVAIRRTADAAAIMAGARVTVVEDPADIKGLLRD